MERGIHFNRDAPGRKKMITSKKQQIFDDYPEVLYNYADISYSPFSKEYQSALVFAVPYDKQITLDTYTEEGFENSILNARRKLEEILGKLEAVFSFKYAAVNAGLGLIGKADARKSVRSVSISARTKR